ncbi:hypothetical protein Droror1_Dr00024428 [Drosera rotundifolia]
MDHKGFWRFVTVRKKELDMPRTKILIVSGNCVDPSRFVLESISEMSEVFSIDKRERALEIMETWKNNLCVF